MVKRRIIGIILIFALIAMSLNIKVNVVEAASDNDWDYILTEEDVVLDTERITIMSVCPSVELWHYSGGYWGNGDVRIDDDDLREFIIYPDDLAQALAEQVSGDNAKTWTYDLDEEALEMIEAYEGQVDVVVSVNSSSIESVENMFITSEESEAYAPQFYVDLDTGQIQIKCYPKFNFSGFYTDLSYMQTDTLFRLGATTPIPVAESPYGYNVYSMFSKSTNASLGVAISTDAPDAVEGQSIGTIYYGDILIDSNNETIIERADDEDDAYDMIIGGDTYSSDEVTIGNQTFQNGGAVGVHFNYPFTIEIYPQNVVEFSIEYEGEAVTDNLDSPIQVLEGEAVTVDLMNLSTLENAISYEWFEEDEGVWQSLGSFTSKADLEDIVIEDPATMFKLAVTTDDGTTVDSPIYTTHQTCIDVIEEAVTTSDYVIDYNELSADFSYAFNGSSGVSFSSGSAPHDGTWTENLKGTYSIVAPTISLLLENTSYSDNSVNTSGNSQTIYPRYNFVSHRAYFLDEPEDGVYLSNNQYTVDFNVSGSGENDREYEYEYEVEDDTITDGGLSVWDDGTKTIIFDPPESATITVQVNTYNGSATNPTTYLPTEEVSSSDNDTRNIVWEGNRLPFFVSRTMYAYDGTAVEVPGQYVREFQPDNEASISFEPAVASFYDSYRDETISIDGLYMNAPYTLDSSAYEEYTDSGRMTLKSGYFYESQGKFVATVETTAYVNGTSTSSYEDTGHQSLVDDVAGNFTITTNIPTTTDPGSTSYFTAGYANGLGDFDVSYATSTSSSVTKLSNSDYEKNMEYNWTYLYDEFLSTLSQSELETISSHTGIYSGVDISQARQDIYKVVETTEITFNVKDLSPESGNAYRNYSYVKATDGDYYMAAYIDGVTLEGSYIEDANYSGNLSIAELPKYIDYTSYSDTYFSQGYIYKFVIDGNMYEDIYVTN